MSDSTSEAESSSETPTQTTRKRSPPFSRAELIFLVGYMEEREYGFGERGSINSNKASILQDLVCEMETKFGVTHSERQIQKRYSDLKVRERDTYESIKRKIARDKGKAPIQPTRLERLELAGQDPTPVTNDAQGASQSGEELITLTLEPIPDDPMSSSNQGPNIPQSFEAHLAEMERRIQSNLDMLQSKLESMGESIDKRLCHLEKSVETLIQKSILMD
ncbi:uncharacterized protein LOC130355367 [Hyla sarda]|uniref:uncharacterized protein LOC130355367 n=1 Tax=Hyla sarda TaxID=327740 RepID=UPI0024C3AA34|nr:uncharacterized protein LOC130355367 [Hyla sarda]